MVIDNAAPSADQGFGFVYEGYGAKIKTKSEFDDEAAARFVESATKQETASERVAKTLIGAASGVAVVGMAIWRLAGRKHPKATFVPKTSFAVCFSPFVFVSETDRILGKHQGYETRDTPLRDATVPCKME